MNSNPFTRGGCLEESLNFDLRSYEYAGCSLGKSKVNIRLTSRIKSKSKLQIKFNVSTTEYTLSYYTFKSVIGAETFYSLYFIVNNLYYKIGLTYEN